MSQAARTNTTPYMHRPQEVALSVNMLPSRPVELMAALVRTMGVDLEDEREVMRVLIGARFSADQVKNLMDEAIALAR